MRISNDLFSRPPSWPPYVPPQPVRTTHNPLRAFSGPYAYEERWMMENAIADLRRAHRPFRLVRETSDRPDLLSIFVQ
jgi:hypothetical protein